MYYIQSNSGRVWATSSRAEARFYAVLSLVYNTYNVYKVGGNGLPLGHYEI